MCHPESKRIFDEMSDFFPKNIDPQEAIEIKIHQIAQKPFNSVAVSDPMLRLSTPTHS